MPKRPTLAIYIIFSAVKPLLLLLPTEPLGRECFARELAPYFRAVPEVAGGICADDDPSTSKRFPSQLSHRKSSGACSDNGQRAAETRELDTRQHHTTMKKAVACTSLVCLASLGGSLAFVAVPPSARPRSSFGGDGLARLALSSQAALPGARSR